RSRKRPSTWFRRRNSPDGNAKHRVNIEAAFLRESRFPMGRLRKWKKREGPFFDSVSESIRKSKNFLKYFRSSLVPFLHLLPATWQLHRLPHFYAPLRWSLLNQRPRASPEQSIQPRTKKAYCAGSYWPSELFCCWLELHSGFIG